MKCSNWNFIFILAGILLAGVISVMGNDDTNHSVKMRMEMDRGILYAGKVEKAVLKITLVPPAPPSESTRLPVNLCVVLDRSGSMSGDKLRQAKLAASQALRRLRPFDIFSLVSYDDDVRVDIPAQQVHDVERLDRIISRITTGGSTNLYGGVTVGASEIRKNRPKGYFNRIILLSDGLANVGPDSPAQLGQLGRALKLEDISVSTVGMGLDYNEDTMTSLSKSGEGNTYFVEAAVDLPRIFDAELGDATSVVARQAILEIELAPGIKPLRLVGRQGTIDDSRVQVEINQLYGSQEKYILLEVEVPAGKSGVKQQLASSNLSYQDVLNNRVDQENGLIEVSFSSDEKTVLGSVNRTVNRDYADNLIAMAQEEAIAMIDHGDIDQALNYMKDSYTFIESYNDVLQDEYISSSNSILMGNTIAIENNGLQNKARKSMKTSNYQIMNQQNSVSNSDVVTSDSGNVPLTGNTTTQSVNVMTGNVVAWPSDNSIQTVHSGNLTTNTGSVTINSSNGEIQFVGQTGNPDIISDQTIIVQTNDLNQELTTDQQFCPAQNDLVENDAENEVEESTEESEEEDGGAGD